ncbi:50S ribosomal protein L4 [Candidatus Woesearchaeota archaeon]|nr:50S ribosomal protein L4 [Candidatus Woesearchaeota archaeon]
MKLNIVAQGLENKGNVEMPVQFSEDVRLEIIKRAVEAEQSSKRQPYGAAPLAGKKHSAYVSKRRNDFKSTYGIGQSRTPRKVVSRSGSRHNWVGAVAPMTVGGRRAHPPKAEKNWLRKVNNKERNFALRSAITATLSNDLATKRGHVVPKEYPFVVEGGVEKLGKTKDVKKFLESIGIKGDLERASIRKVRAGKGKARGRKYKKRKSALIVTQADCALSKAARNIPGIDVVQAKDLTVEMLAPGAVPGRLTLWTNKAIEKIGKEKMFI